VVTFENGDIGSADVTDVLIRYQALRHEHTAGVQRGYRDNGLRFDSGQPTASGRNGIQDYDVEAAARAMR
jgi:salicylate hydroxylase